MTAIPSIPALDHMVRSLIDPSDSVWTRANVRQRVADIHAILGDALAKFDAEFKKASLDTQTPKRGAKRK